MKNLLSLLRGERFKQQFVVPSRHTIPSDCFKLYVEEKARLRALFIYDSSRVAPITDCWTCVQNLGYLVLIAHFVDNDWNYVERIISFNAMSNHRGDTIGKHVEDVLRNWGLRNVLCNALLLLKR